MRSAFGGIVPGSTDLASHRSAFQPSSAIRALGDIREMIEFLRDAPIGALILFFGGIAVMLIEAPLRLRWKAQMERRSDGPISESPSRLPLLLTPLSWALLIGGLVWWVLAE